MNSKNKTNDICVKEKTVNIKTHNKSFVKNLGEIKFNLEELDILADEIKDDTINNNIFIPNKKSPVNIQLNNEELSILANEIIDSDIQVNDNDKPLLNKKRKRNFISIQNQQEKDNFIHYKQKKNIKHLNNDVSRNKVSILSYNILNQIFMKKLNRPDLDIDDRMHKIKNG